MLSERWAFQISRMFQKSARLSVQIHRSNLDFRVGENYCPRNYIRVIRDLIHDIENSISHFSCWSVKIVCGAFPWLSINCRLRVFVWCWMESKLIMLWCQIESKFLQLIFLLALLPCLWDDRVCSIINQYQARENHNEVHNLNSLRGACDILPIPRYYSCDYRGELDWCYRFLSSLCWGNFGCQRHKCPDLSPEEGTIGAPPLLLRGLEFRNYSVAPHLRPFWPSPIAPVWFEVPNDQI